MTDQDRCDCRTIHPDQIQRARRLALPAAEIEDLALLFKAMGNTTRLQILTALGHGEMCVCDLAALLAVSESGISHQLRELRQLKLVANRRQGPVLYYRLNDQHITDLVRIGLEHIRE